MSTLLPIVVREQLPHTPSAKSSMVWDRQQIIFVSVQIYAMFAAVVLLDWYCTVLSIVVLNRSNMTLLPSYWTKAPETDARLHCESRLMKNTSCYFLLIICIFFISIFSLTFSTASRYLDQEMQYFGRKDTM